MKKTLLYWGALGLTGLALTACSSDVAEEPANDEGKTLYVNVAVRGNVGDTRAAATNGTPELSDFENGDGAESEVKSAYFVFYDATGNVVGDVVSVKLENETVETGNTVEKYYKSVVPVSVRKGQTKPTQVICYVNPISPAALTTPLNQIQTVTRKEVKSDDGFAMSNSVYYGGNATDPTIATPIQEGQLFETEDAAIAAEGGNVLDVYVERYASKLAFSTKNATPYTTQTMMLNGSTNEVVLSFNAERWAVNGEANDEYVVKSFRQAGAAGQILSDNYSFSALDAIIGGKAGAWGWNNNTFHRSYWACSPAYFTAEYPVVSGDVNKLTLNQHYYTYAELSGDNAKGFDATNTTAQYFRETTVGEAAIASQNPTAAMPSVILVGKYTLTVAGTAVPANTTFYTYQKNGAGKALVYFEAGADGNSAVDGGESILNRLMDQVTVLFKDVNGVKTPLTREELMAIVEIARPSNTVLGSTTEGDNKLKQANVTLQLKADAVTTDIYVANGNGYELIGTGANQVSTTEVNRLLLTNVGYAEKYAAGMAYFNVPVRHYGWYRADNANKDAKTLDWSKVKVGDFGMVRNHSYQVNVNKIEGLGAGLYGTDVPIVPPTDEKNYYVSYRVNILKWAIVPTQSVDL